METCPQRTERTGVLQKRGRVWIVEHAGLTASLHDLTGLHYLAILLAHPNERFSSVDLCCASESSARRRTSAATTTPALSVTERARFRISHAIRRAIAQIASCHTSLGFHLRATIHTGSFFAYDPSPEGRIAWRISRTSNDESNDD